MSPVDDQLIERLSELPDTELISEIKSLKLKNTDIHQVAAGLPADRFVRLLKLLPVGTAQFLLSKSNSQRLTDIMYALPDSALPTTTLKQLVTRLAQTADRTSQTNFLHYAFSPDRNVLELGARHLNEVWSDTPQSIPVLQPATELCHNLDGDGPIHRLLIGDNFHALAGVQAFYAARPSAGGAYDLIYIDPPYNTGRQDMAYNDKFVGEDDPFRHTKWMSFMEPRLILARDLMKDTGVIFVAIGGEELHTLKTMCDSIFGRSNFIDQIQWEGERKNNDRFISDSVEYMLVYARNKVRLIEDDVSWLDRDIIADDYFALAREVWDGTASIADVNERRESARKVFATASKRKFGTITSSLKTFNRFDDRGRLYSSDGGNVSKPTGRDAPNYYDVIHPVTGQVCTPPNGGYRYSEASMQRLIANGEIEFGKDHTTQVKKRRFEYEGMVPGSVFNRSRRNGNDHLASIIGRDVFGNPKDYTVLARWFRMAATKDAKILDFFGGSGSTAEAVLLLNQQDGGTREVTIITNDDVDTRTGLRIGTDITRERIVRVMTGEGWADGKPHAGYGGRLLVQRVATTPLPTRRPVYESEHHRMDGVFGQWATWMRTPILKESTDAYMVFTNADESEHSVVYHNIDVLSGGVVDEVVDRFPHATTFMPVYANRSSVRFYVEDVPNVVAHPAPARDIIDKAVRNAVHTPYTRRGATNLNTVRTVLLEAIRKPN